MKKTIALILAVLMALAVSGCSESLQQIEIPPFPEVTPTPVPFTPTPEPEGTAAENGTAEQTEETLIPATAGETQEAAKPRILATFQRTEKNQMDPNAGEERILSFSYDVIRLVSEELPETVQKINETLAAVEESFDTGNDYGLDLHFLGFDAMLEAAEDNYNYLMGGEESAEEGEEEDAEAPEEEENGEEPEEENREDEPTAAMEFSDTLTGRVTRLDEKLFSLVYDEVSFTGGAHGNGGSFGLTFDMSTGERLTLDQLGKDPESFADFLVRTMLDMAEADEDGYYSDRIMESFLPAGGREEAFRALLREGAWHFDRDGMVISSSLYELGPYAAGVVDFVIPYEKLEDQLDERWLLPADRNGKGRITVDELSALNGGELEILDKLTVREDGEELCLVVEGEVYDVTVSTVFYADQFYDRSQLWCASSLADCAVQLQTVVPDGLPDLRIVYYTGDGVRHGKLLSQSGEDGSYILVDDDIHAVG